MYRLFKQFVSQSETEEGLKNEDDLKNEENHKNEDNFIKKTEPYTHLVVLVFCLLSVC